MANKSGAIHGDQYPSFTSTAAIANAYVATKYHTVRNSIIICEDSTSLFAGILQQVSVAGKQCSIKTSGYSLAMAGGTRAIKDPLTATTDGKLIKATADSQFVYAIALQVIASGEVGEVFILSAPIKRSAFNAELVEVINATTPAPTGLATLYTMTPTASVNVPMAVVGPAGTRMAIKVLTAGTSSYTLTFTTNILATGTLATGTSDAKVFVVNFISDGTKRLEVSRTTAM